MKARLRGQKLLLVVVELEGVLRVEALVDDGGDRLHHREGLLALEHVPAHVDAGGAGLDRTVGELEGLLLGELLAARDHDRHRTLRNHGLKALFRVVGLHERGAVLRAHARRETEVARVARHVLTHGRHAEHGNAVLRAHVDGMHEVVRGDLLARLVAARHHHRHRAHVEANHVLHVVHAVEVEVGEDRRAAVGAQAHGLGHRRGNHAAEDAARAHEAVGILNERVDREVHALKSARRPHDKAVVAREHHGVPGLRVEDAREAVLHAPALVLVALEEELLDLLGLVEAVSGGLLESIHISHKKINLSSL